MVIVTVERWREKHSVPFYPQSAQRRDPLKKQTIAMAEEDTFGIIKPDAWGQPWIESSAAPLSLAALPLASSSPSARR